MKHASIYKSKRNSAINKLTRLIERAIGPLNVKEKEKEAIAGLVDDIIEAAAAQIRAEAESGPGTP